MGTDLGTGRAVGRRAVRQKVAVVARVLSESRNSNVQSGPSGSPFTGCPEASAPGFPAPEEDDSEGDP